MTPNIHSQSINWDIASFYLSFVEDFKAQIEEKLEAPQRKQCTINIWNTRHWNYLNIEPWFSFPVHAMAPTSCSRAIVWHTIRMNGLLFICCDVVVAVDADAYAELWYCCGILMLLSSFQLFFFDAISFVYHCMPVLHNFMLLYPTAELFSMW